LKGKLKNNPFMSELEGKLNIGGGKGPNIRTTPISKDTSDIPEKSTSETNEPGSTKRLEHLTKKRPKRTGRKTMTNPLKHLPDFTLDTEDHEEISITNNEPGKTEEPVTPKEQPSNPSETSNTNESKPEDSKPEETPNPTVVVEEKKNPRRL